MLGDPTAPLVLAALEGAGSGRLAADALADVLRRNPQLTRDERGRVARRTLGIACLHRRLDYLLTSVGLEPSPALRVAAHAVDVEGLAPDAACLAAGLPPDVGGALSRFDDVRWPEEPVARLAAERSLPDWLAALWSRELGGEAADALARATNLPGPTTLRANTLRVTRDALLERLRREGISCVAAKLAPDALHVQGRANLFGSASWREGLFEVQDEGSQLVARLAAAPPGSRVVDFCAGAGGKTLALAALLGDRGALFAFDPDLKRLADLSTRLRRARLTCVNFRPLPADAPAPEALVGTADVVLVDAPCSSLGTLRRSPDARWRMNEEELARYPRLQLEILKRAAPLVRPGGRLVYATCTLARAENDDVASAFVHGAPDFREQPVEEVLGELATAAGARGRLSLSPDRHGTDGFFACAFVRSA